MISSTTPVFVVFQNNSPINSSSSTSQSATFVKVENEQNVLSSCAFMDNSDSNQKDFELKFQNITEGNLSKQVATSQNVFMSTKSSDDSRDASETEIPLTDQIAQTKFLLLPTEVNQQLEAAKPFLLMASTSAKTFIPPSYPPNKLPLPRLLPEDLLYECKDCTKTFRRKRDLNDHVTTEHVKKEKVKKPTGNFVCSLCNKVFTTKKGESSHRISIHGIRKNKKYIICKEVGCNAMFGRITELRSHLRQQHKFYEIENYKELKFNTKEEFNQWLAAEEITSQTHFISLVSERECLGYTFSEFGCNRGGIYHPQEPCEGKIPRNIKAQGTSKIGFQCTARVRVKDFKSYIEVAYFPEHYKHEKSLSHLPLPKLEKAEIKEKLLQGVDEKKILQDLKLSMRNVERKHLVTRKHLDNFKRQLGIKRTSHQPTLENDEESVCAWVKEMQQKDYNPVLLYKRQADKFEGLDYDDFMLVLMTAFQKTMLAEFYYTTVCIHCMDRISDYDFELLTLILTNEHEEGVPVAFCIVSTICEETVTAFLNCIKEVQNLKPKIFIGNDLPLFYNVWENIFNSCELCFLSSWNVMGQWQNQLRSIKKKSKKDEVLKILKTLMFEPSEEVFSGLLKDFAQFNNDDDTKEFCNYFMTCYHARSHMWAYCFRKEVKLQSDMHINIFHKNLKQLLLGKKPRRIDKCIVKLVNLVSDKKFSDFVKSQKQIKDDLDKNVGIPCIAQCSDIEWEVISESGNSYRIIKDKSLCKCDGTDETVCHTTTKAFKCSCNNYLASSTPCEHINFIFEFAETNFNFTIEIEDEESNIETAITSMPVVIEPSYFSTSIRKQIASIASKLDSVQTLNDNVSQQIYEHVKQIESIKNFEKPFISKTPIIPKISLFHDKNNVTRKRFFSVKKESESKKAHLSIEAAGEDLGSAESILENLITSPIVKKDGHS